MKGAFLKSGNMRDLHAWRRYSKKLFEYEKQVYAVFSPRELMLYAYSERVKELARTMAQPLLSWWYGNKADRAYEQYVRQKTDQDLYLWYRAETRAAFARGVADWHVSYAGKSHQDGQRLLTEAWLLRKVRTDWSKTKQTQPLL